MTDDGAHRFKVIQGGPKADGKPKKRPYRAQAKGDLEQVTCVECEKDIGIDTSLWAPALQSPMRRGGKVFGGVKAMHCVYCLGRGKTTILSG